MAIRVNPSVRGLQICREFANRRKYLAANSSHQLSKPENANFFLSGFLEAPE